MDHAITIRDIVWPIVIIGGLLGLGAICIGLVALFNPFRSGH